MKAVTLNKNKFESLINLDVPIINTEGNLYILNDNLIFKRFYIDEGEYFGNKLLTLNTLIDNKEILSNKNLILPEKIVLVNNKVVGFTMPYIKDNINLTILLEDKNIQLEQKLKYLKKVGDILENVQNVKEFKENFFLGDVHTSNFIIKSKNLKLQKMYAVDLDSCKIANNMPFASKMLATNFNLRNNKKYKLSKNGLIKPDENTEWFCYNMMILNFIGNFNINRLSEKQFYKYIQYLEDLGFNKELIYSFSKVYSKTESNENPKEFIDSIPDDYQKADYRNFKKKL